MNTRHLEYMLEVEKYHSINKAAAHLFVAQSYLSSIIKKIEQDIGYKIFVRTPSGIIVSDEGRMFLECAKKIQKQVKNIYEIKNQMKKNNGLSFTTVYSSAILQCFLDFQSMYGGEGQQDIFYENGYDDVIESVATDEVRLGILIRLKDVNDFQAYNLTFHSIVHEVPVRAVVHERHPLACQKTVTITELAASPFVYYNSMNKDELLNIFHFPTNHKVLYVNDRGSHNDILRTGEYATISLEISNRLKQYSGFRCLPIEGNPLMAEVIYIKRKDYVLNEREKQFLFYLKETLKNKFYRANAGGR